MCFFGDGGSANNIAEQTRADETSRQARIKSGMGQIDTAFAPFDDNFYKKRQQDYVDYATPDLERQSTEARNNMVYALSRTGNLDSSAAIKSDTDLTRATDAQRVAVQDAGLNQADALRSNVESTRSGVVSELNATGDDASAANTALRQAQNINTPVGYTPLGDLFGSFASAAANIGSNSANSYRGLAGGAGSGAALFRSGAGAQRVVGG